MPIFALIQGVIILTSIQTKPDMKRISLLALIAIILISGCKTTKDLWVGEDLAFSPPEWQTAICLPDDPHKSLVDKSGELLYHYRQGGREFGTRIGVRLDTGEKWAKQELYSPRIPIVETTFLADQLEIIQETFADIELRPAPQDRSDLRRTDDGGYLKNWANPSSDIEKSIRNIAVHMDGSISYELVVPAGESRSIALVLCEGYWKETGRRIQSLIVEGAETKTIDLIEDVGHNEVASFWFNAIDQNLDGKIQLTINAAGSDKNTILNGLWVFKSDTKPDHKKLLNGKMNASALADTRKLQHSGPSRDDLMLVRIKNIGNNEQSLNPKIEINSTLPVVFNTENQLVSIDGGESLCSSLRMVQTEQQNETQYLVELEEINVKPGKTIEFYIQYTNGFSRERGIQEKRSLEQVHICRDQARDYWDNHPLIPFNKIHVPDAGIQGLMESSIRNIWQAREIKNGLPAFQVGPTCYRGLWIVDGAFLLEAAAILGAGEQARNGVAYELTTQKEDGRIQSLAPDFWKENGIVLWTCTRHALLTQDKEWLESIWPKLQLVAEFIQTLRKQTLENDSPLDDGLHPAGTLDGGIGGTHDEYTNSYWNLAGLRAFIKAAKWLGKKEEASYWQKEYDDFIFAFEKAVQRDKTTDHHGNLYLPMLMGEAGKKHLPQRAQWAFCHAVYPGQIFSKDDPIANGNLKMLEATEKEGMVYGTGWDAKGIWNYFASFYGHAMLWQGDGEKAAELLYAFGNHAAPTLVWREEQSLKGADYKKVGDMPHNWASAEFIRLMTHLLAIDRGNELHLFEGLPVEWIQAGMVTKLSGIATPFGDLSFELKVNKNGDKASLEIEALSDPSCESIILHKRSFTKGDDELIKIDPRSRHHITIDIFSFSN